MPFVKTEVRYQAIFKQSLKMATGHHLSVAELIRYRLTPSAAPQNLKSTTVPAISQSVSRESVHIDLPVSGPLRFSDVFGWIIAMVDPEHGQGSASGEFKALTVE
jgi:hypothetical protein